MTSLLIGGITTVNAEDELDSCETITPYVARMNNSITEYGNSLIELKDVIACYETSVKEEILIDDRAIALYTTYDNPEAALSQISIDCAGIIQEISNIYNIGEFSDSTWNEYYDKLEEYINDNNSIYSSLSSQYNDLLVFFDVYENDDINDELKSRASTFNSFEDVLNDAEFLERLPYHVINDMRESNVIEDNNISSYSSTYAYSSSAAVTYATNYAENPNSAYPYYSGADCANFASQILYAGGKAQTATWYSYKDSGTWYQSRAWTVANSFAYTHGVDNSYSSFSAFSQQLKKGDFICYDSSGDGEWDHIGFVVAVASSYNSSLGYKNFRVAQHSRNYLLWASHDNNGWTNFIGNVNCELGIIRI